MRLGDYLFKHPNINEEQVKKALEIQAETGGKIGEILLATTNIRALDYYKILAQHYQLEFYDLLKDQTYLTLLKNGEKEKYLSQMYIPVALKNGSYVIATSDPSPEVFQKIKKDYGDDTIIACTSKFDILWALQQKFKTNYLESSIHELSEKHYGLSAKFKTPTWLKLIYSLPFFAVIALCFFDTPLALLILNITILFGLSFMVFFKIFLSLIGVTLNFRKKHSNEKLIDQKALPIYSILIPLYKENQTTLNNLFFNLKKMIYPKHKLDIKILLEEDDFSTIQIVKKMRLPSYFELIYIPAGEPRTKAKACNYGFKFVRGEYVCLYDAEDNPDPDQLIRVVQLFKQGKKNLACIQCKLNFYNSNENWLTRMFTIEYTYWFDLLLPALSFTKIPIPLGGTSNHFRTDILQEVSAWDPFNVTEDADLGLRLSRLGYKTEVLDSTTYEEANCQLLNWIKQRTRWVKGYMQTYAVYMRHPFKLWHKIGSRGFLGFQLFIGGTVFSNLTNLPMWIISISLLLLPAYDTSYYFPGHVHTLALINLYAGTVGLVLLNSIGALSRSKKQLALWAFTAPLYWLLMSIASYRALYQLFFCPSYWDRTQHGISDLFKYNGLNPQETTNMWEISEQSGVKFGTSGLRAKNEALTDKICYKFIFAFLQYLEEIQKISPNDRVIIAGDYRDNTEHLIKVIIKAATDQGYSVEYCGNIPTPALAYYCILSGSPGIMVTGSHIAKDMNGIKFYTKEGEITKLDEEQMLSQTIQIDNTLFDDTNQLNKEYLYSAPLSHEAMRAFMARYLDFYTDRPLEGLNIGVYKHSSVGAPILIDLLNNLGANVFIFGELGYFYSLDTEALTEFDKDIVKEQFISNQLDAVVSTDSDADRPLLTNEYGDWIRGDTIGMLCAFILGAEYVVTPISSNSSVEKIPSFTEVIRTKIGSPYVIEKINELRQENLTHIIGYEANGGVIVGTDFTKENKTLSALPTRDSIIAIISILAYSKKNKIKISQLASQYCSVYTESSSIKSISVEKIKEFFDLLNKDDQIASNLEKFLTLKQSIIHINTIDGICATLSDYSKIHFRASGNSPELRCYTEAATPEQAKDLNQYAMNKLTEWSNAHEKVT